MNQESHILEQYQYYVSEHMLKATSPLFIRKLRNVIDDYQDYSSYPSELPFDLRLCFKFLKDALTMSEDVFCEYFYHHQNEQYAVRYYYFNKTVLFFIDFEEVVLSNNRRVYKIKVNDHLCDSLEDMLQFFMDKYFDLMD